MGSYCQALGYLTHHTAVKKPQTTTAVICRLVTHLLQFFIPTLNLWGYSLLQLLGLQNLTVWKEVLHCILFRRFQIFRFSTDSATDLHGWENIRSYLFC